MSVASISRNASCPCGSGKKYKRCCLAGEENAVRDALFDDAVGHRIQEWAAEHFDDEIGGALQRYLGPERRVLYDDDFMLSPPGSTTTVSSREEGRRQNAMPRVLTCRRPSARRRRGSPQHSSDSTVSSRQSPGARCCWRA